LFNLISDETKLWSSALKKYLSEEPQLRQLALEISNHKSSILGTQFEKINALIHVHTQKNWLSHNPKLVVHEPLNIKKSKTTNLFNIFDFVLEVFILKRLKTKYFT